MPSALTLDPCVQEKKCQLLGTGEAGIEKSRSRAECLPLGLLLKGVGNGEHEGVCRAEQ